MIIHKNNKQAWNKILDNYLTTGKMTSNEYESLDYEQIKIIQEIKKSFKRICQNYKQKQ
jgi:hypothetical protein